MKKEDQTCLEKIRMERGPAVVLPDGSKITSTKVGLLPISDSISEKGRKARIVPGLKSASLISLGQLADDGCDVRINDKRLKVTKEKETIMTGHRNYTDGLYDVHITKTKDKRYDIDKIAMTKLNMILEQRILQDKQLQNAKKKLNHDELREIEKSNVIIQRNKKPAELVEFLHGCCGSPVKSTFLKAIKKGYFNSWPGLTTKLVNDHLLPSPATAKGHIKQERQHLQSTKIKTEDTVTEKDFRIEDQLERQKIEDDFFPSRSYQKKEKMR